MARASRSLLLAAAILFAPAAAYAAPSAEAVAKADALFTEGRNLLDTGRYAEACVKLAESQRLDPASGTLINLADCYERDGKPFVAWQTFEEASTLATKEHNEERAGVAHKRAESLTDRLPSITFTGRVPDGATLFVDSTEIAASALGEPKLVPNGRYTVEVRGRDGTWRRVVEVREAGPHPVELPASLATAAPPSSLTPMRWAGIATAGAGVVAFGIGTFFGFRASSLKDDAGCTATCLPERAGTYDDARSAAHVSTATFAIGGVLVLAGAALFVLGGGKER